MLRSLQRQTATSSQAVCSSSSVSTSCCSAVGLLHATNLLRLHSKKTSGHTKKTKHNHVWYRKAKGNYLTAKTIDELQIKPPFPAFNEEVDRPLVPPAKEDCVCFQCKGEVDIDERDRESYLWIPSGNAKYPTSSGYFFHTRCFRCNKCGFRFHHNKFYSQDDKAICMGCALGRQSEYPYRWWHGNEATISRGRLASRMSSHQFPRHQHQVEFLHNPDS